MSDVMAGVKGNSIRILKEANKYLIFQCIMKLAPISTEEIVKHTGLSRPTVLNVVKELTEEKIVVKEGFSESSGGRTAALLTPSGEGHFALGVDLEFPTVRLAIANLRGEIRAQKTVEFARDTGAQALLDGLLLALDELIASSGIERRLIDGIGVGLPGVIDTVNGVSLNIERISGWHDVPIQRELESRLNMPAYIRNDVHLMGLMEKRLYLGDALQDFIYIGLRTGIGSVVYQHGRPVYGEKGNAGFIGHTSLDPRGPRCCCGSRGCLEAYAGKPAVADRYAEALGTGERPGFDEIVARARTGDEKAAGVLTEAGFYFGVTLANLIKTLEIPHVIIGGSPGLEDSPFMTSARRTMNEYMSGSLRMQVDVRCGRLPVDRCALGGCFLVLDHLFSKPKLALSLV